MIYRIVFALLAGKAAGFAAFHEHDHHDDAKTNALSPSSSSVLSRAVFLASKFGVQENGTLLQFCNSNSSGSR